MFKLNFLKTKTFLISSFLICGFALSFLGNAEASFFTSIFWKKRSSSTGGTPGTWVSTPTTGAAPAARTLHTAVWTGTRMIVWGGLSNNGSPVYYNDGASYDPATNSWTAIATAPITARFNHSAVWTGTRMIVWGGANGSTNFNDGASYNPSNNTWTIISSTGAPTVRSAHTAVWSGTEMIVWGGQTSAGLRTGGKYNPSTNTWAATTLTGAPTARSRQVAVWTGTRMVVWGGANGVNSSDTGGVYNPGANSWSATSASGNPSERHDHRGVWTGSQLVIYGGTQDNLGGALDDGGIYSPPSSNSWTSFTGLGITFERANHSAVWTGTHMVIWGGYIPSTVKNGTPTIQGGGLSYDPGADTWAAVATSGAPAPRYYHTAVWTGSKMIVWGGSVTISFTTGTNTGAVWTP